jgi:hypothetical protein
LSVRLPLLDARALQQRRWTGAAGFIPEARVAVERPMVCVVSPEPAHGLSFVCALIDGMGARPGPLVVTDARLSNAGHVAALHAAGAQRVVALADEVLPGELVAALQGEPRAVPAIGLGWGVTGHVRALLTVCIVAPASLPGVQERAFRKAWGEFDLRVGAEAVAVAQWIGESWMRTLRFP